MKQQQPDIKALLPPYFKHGKIEAKLHGKENLLGEGALSAVYRGRNHGQACDVAIKFYNLRDAQAQNAWQIEAQVSARLRKYGFGAAHLRVATDSVSWTRFGLGVLIMPLLPAQTLEAEIRQRATERTPFTVAQVLCLSRQLALAVERLHDHGIAHRDIKCENISYAENGMVTLFDFGLSDMKAEDRLDKPLMVDTAKGTPYYMAPEVVTGKAVVFDAYAADMWGVGQVMFEIICMRGQFWKVKDFGQLQHAMAQKRPDPTLEPEVAAEPIYQELLRRTLVYHAPYQRATASELVAFILDCEDAVQQQQQTAVLREVNC